MKVVVIGGVAGGMSAATRLRRLDAQAEIVVLERSRHVSYANCGLPYYVGGVIEEESDLLLQTPESLGDRFALDVRVRQEAVAIDAGAKVVRVVDLSTGRAYDEPYDVLVLSPGASPVIPDLPGKERLLALRTVEDAERLVEAVADGARTAVVIGGGFIGLEVTENLVRRGVATSVVEAAGHVLAPLDDELATLVDDELVRNGVGLHLGDTVAQVRASSVVLASGAVLDADLVLSAIGVRPDTALARAAGLALGPRGGIAVDEFLRTSDPSIYAVGDAAEKPDALDGQPALVPLANLANRQGRLVADHVAGVAVAPRPVIATSIVRVFSLTAAATGWNERRLRAAGRDPLCLHTHPTSHATYYPGALTLSMKLLVDRGTGRILGAQAVGPEGVDKRIDVIATAMRGGVTAPELADLELAYAPPFGSAKDPVNMLGYVAQNALSGLVEIVQWSELEARRAAGATLVDVRTREEFAEGTIPGARNVPLDGLRDSASELEGDVVVFCEVGQRGYVAARLLGGAGVAAANLDGGYRTWAQSPAAALQAVGR